MTSHNPAEINQDALKRCPFCGAEGKMIHPLGERKNGKHGPNGSRIICSSDNCPTSGRVFYGPDQDQQAIDAWNRRAALPQEGAAVRRAVLAEREACAKLLDSNAEGCRALNFFTLAEAAEGVAAAIRRRPAP